MDDRQPLSNPPLTADSKGKRKRKHSEMLKQQLEAFKEQNGFEKLIDLVQAPGSATDVQSEACAADESSKPGNLNDLLLASQEVGKTLNSLLDQIQ